MDIVDIITILRKTFKFNNLISHTLPGYGLFIKADSLRDLEKGRYTHEYMSPFRITKKWGTPVYLEYLKPEYILIGFSLVAEYQLYPNSKFKPKTCECKGQKDLRCKICKNFWWCENCKGSHADLCKSTTNVLENLKVQAKSLKELFDVKLSPDEYLFIYFSFGKPFGMIIKIDQLDRKLGAINLGHLVELYNPVRERFEYFSV